MVPSRNPTRLLSRVHFKKALTRTYATAEPEESLAELQNSLPGTVEAHRCLVLLNSAVPPTKFPARFSTKIQRALQLRIKKLGGLVNFAWYGDEGSNSTGGVEPNNRNSFSTALAGATSHSAVAFSSLNGRLDIPEVSADNIEEVAKLLERHMTLESPSGIPSKAETDEIHLYVCTHGARDCRCGDTGGKVIRTLREEVAKLPPRKEGEPAIRIGEVGHIGGHKYAANVLVFPRGEWLGLVNPDNVPKILSEILQRRPKPFGTMDPLLAPSHWRGRMGIGKDEQIELFKQSQ